MKQESEGGGQEKDRENKFKRRRGGKIMEEVKEGVRARRGDDEGRKAERRKGERRWLRRSLKDQKEQRREEKKEE